MKNRTLTVSIFNVLATLIVLMLMAPVGGPTVKTPRLRVGTGAVPAANDLHVTGNASVDTNLTVTGASSFTGAINANAITVTSCTGCGLPAETSFVATWSIGCAAVAPTSTVRVQPFVAGGNGMAYINNDDANVTCTSNGVELETAAGTIPIAVRPLVTMVVQGQSLSLAGVETPACLLYRSNGSMAYKTGTACATSPGNVAKVITAGRQNNFAYQFQ